MTLLELLEKGFEPLKIDHEKKQWIFSHLKNNGLFIAQQFTGNGSCKFLFNRPLLVGTINEK